MCLIHGGVSFEHIEIDNLTKTKYTPIVYK